MDPLTIAALISAVGGTAGGVMTSQANKETKLKELEQKALQNAIKMQGDAYQNQGASSQNAYNSMLNAYRGIL